MPVGVGHIRRIWLAVSGVNFHAVVGGDKCLSSDKTQENIFKRKEFRVRGAIVEVQKGGAGKDVRTTPDIRRVHVERVFLLRYMPI